MWTKGAELHKPPHRPPIIQSSICMYYITFMHLADVFIQRTYSAFRLYIYCQYVFPGNRTHNLCAANAMLYHWTTGTLLWTVLTSKIVLKSLNSLLMCWYLVFPAPQRCGDLCPIKSPEKQKTSITSYVFIFHYNNTTISYLSLCNKIVKKHYLKNIKIKKD